MHIFQDLLYSLVKVTSLFPKCQRSASWNLNPHPRKPHVLYHLVLILAFPGSRSRHTCESTFTLTQGNVRTTVLSAQKVLANQTKHLTTNLRISGCQLSIISILGFQTSSDLKRHKKTRVHQVAKLFSTFEIHLFCHLICRPQERVEQGGSGGGESGGLDFSTDIDLDQVCSSDLKLLAL